MKLLKYLISVTILVSSCYTANKAAKQTNKAANHYPEVVATVAKQRFPNPIVTTDTNTKKVMVPYFVECPEAGEESPLMELTLDEFTKLENAGQVAKAKPKNKTVSKPPDPADSSKKTQTKRGVLINVPSTTTTITNGIKDSAQEVLLQAEVRTLKSKVATKHQWLVVGFTLAAAFLLINILLIFLLVKRNKTTNL